jgi:arsenical pump membrane protein
VAQRENLPAGFGEFSRIGLVTVPVILVAGVLQLWAGVALFGI